MTKEQLWTRLMELARIEPGWDSYGADVPNDWSLLHAHLGICHLIDNDIFIKKVNPSVLGGVGCNIEVNNLPFYVEFQNARSISGVSQDGKDFIWAWEHWSDIADDVKKYNQ